MVIYIQHNLSNLRLLLLFAYFFWTRTNNVTITVARLVINYDAARINTDLRKVERNF